MDYERKQPRRRGFASIETRILWTYFPVTMERLTLFGLPGDVEIFLRQNTIANWQIQQAVCNISLSKRISNGSLHYKNLASVNEFERRVAEALRSFFEELDGDFQSLHRLTAQDILTQVTLDGRYLLNQVEEPNPSTELPDIQRLLAARDLLT